MNPAEDMRTALAGLIEPLDGEPSLLARLMVGSLAVASRNGAGSALRSRPPVSADLLSLLDDIQRRTAVVLQAGRVRSRWALWPDGTRAHDLPAELKCVLALLVPGHPIQASEWTTLLERWTRDAVRILGLGESKIQLPRDTRCLDCQARDVLERTAEGEPVLTPAVRLIWQGDSITGIWCRACGITRVPADLHIIAREQFAVARTAG